MRPLLLLGAILVNAMLSYAMPILAQTSSSLVRSDPGTQYERIRLAFAQLYAQGALTRLDNAKSEEAYDLETCTTGTEFLGSSSDESEPIAPFAALAHDVVVWTGDLTRLGFPQAVVRPPVDRYEADELRRLAGARAGTPAPDADARMRLLSAMAEELNAYRKQAGPSLPEITVEGGCGAGDFGVKIATDPPNGIVSFIPVFFYELCRAQNLDPDDFDRCDRWRSAADGILNYVSGDYVFRATWPDGTSRKGRLSFNHLEEDQTVVFRKP